MQRVVIANPLQGKAIAHAHVKNDKVDAGTLANLFAAGFLPEIWTPETERKRRLARAPRSDRSPSHADQERGFMRSCTLTSFRSVLGAAHHGRISKVGRSHARAMLVEAAWAVAKAPGPLHAFFVRLRARRGHPIAAVALAR